jgi:hypothetical protein
MIENVWRMRNGEWRMDSVNSVDSVYSGHSVRMDSVNSVDSVYSGHSVRMDSVNSVDIVDSVRMDSVNSGPKEKDEP